MSYPTTPEFSAINITSRTSNVVTETKSGRRQVRSIGAQRWSFTAKYNNLTRDEFMPVYAFVMSQKGQLGTFTVVPPVIGSSRGDVSGSMLVNGNHNIGDSTVAVDGFTGTIKAGDFVKFAGHNKVYMVVADLTGAGDLTIEPPLTVAANDGDAVTYDSVPFTVRLNNDVQEYGLSGYDKYGFEIDFVEAL